MSLDKWIKSGERKEAKKKPEENKRKQEKNGVQLVKKDQEKKNIEPITQKINKFHLKCSKKGCNYQKTIVKKDLNEKDTICPRCKNIMKVK